MSLPSWLNWTLPTPDLDLACAEIGKGPLVVVLHGGPGDNHRPLRPLAEPLASQFRCVLYDQRGTGGSPLDRLDETSLSVERFVADLEALRVHLGQNRLRLVGHSWGAMLALLYATRYPDRIERLALIGTGPLDQAMSDVVHANLWRAMSVEERAEDNRLKDQRQAAIQAGDLAALGAIKARRLIVNIRANFHRPDLAAQFTDFYLPLLGDLATTSIVNRIVSQSWHGVRPLTGLDHITAPVLALYGYQDCEPITQAYWLREQMPQTQISLLNECGHFPWVEQPAAFYQTLTQFLKD